MSVKAQSHSLDKTMKIIYNNFIYSQVGERWLPELRKFNNRKVYMMAFSIHGIHVPHRKHTQDKPAKPMGIPQTVMIPMSMHIGAPTKPIVKVGDRVCVGTKIAEPGGFVSVPTYASVSGKVSKIRNILSSAGTEMLAVEIETDGEQTVDEGIAPPEIHDRESLMEAVRQSGVVGLGGAGFPTHVKLNVDPSRIEYLIINGAECEPYVTSDTHTMLYREADMEHALRLLCKHYGIRNVIIGIESNKKQAIGSMRKLCAAVSDQCTASVKVLPAVYPQGGEKVLIFNTTGRAIPTGKLPIDVGCVVLNCTTLAAIGNYFKTGMPLIKKCVTVAGGAVKAPCNVIAPIGTKIADLFEFCGGLTETPAKIVYGGPMMGIAIPDPMLPVMKNTNAVLALTAREAKLPKTTACIRCGNCANHCPFGLAPAQIAKAYENKDTEKLTALCVNTCMECGCCSFVCPANRPLVQTNKLAKLLLREEKAKEGAKS